MNSLLLGLGDFHATYRWLPLQRWRNIAKTAKHCTSEVSGPGAQVNLLKKNYFRVKGHQSVTFNPLSGF